MICSLRNAFGLLATLLAVTAGCAAVDPPEPPPAPVVGPDLSIPAAGWRVVLVAGDSSSPAFDNGIETLRERLGSLGVRSIATYSASGRVGRPAIAANIESGIRAASSGEACLVYLTSHGDARGFYLSPERRLLSPATLERALSVGCGERPTVLVVSACHSGTFITAEARRPNRIILAAAATDRTSFGCGAADDYTYYDQCFLQQLDRATTWQGLALATRACVETLERQLGVPRGSRPQPKAMSRSRRRNRR